MIKLRNLITEIIAERMSYDDLMRNSDPARADRASRIPARSLVVKSLNDREAWKFSYKTPKAEITKSPEKPNGERHQGFIYFHKEWMDSGDNANQIPCSVDCSCKDYRYRLSYANKSQDAGENGPNSLNKGLNYPSSINIGPGLCKHLISLKEYLKTQIETEPEPPEEPNQPAEKPVVVPKSPPADKAPPEEPEAEPEEVPQDPTQSPEPTPVEPNQTPTPQVTDPQQAPQKPSEIPLDQPEEEPPVEDPEKKKLKETSGKNRIARALDEFCNKNRIFIV